MSGLIAKAKEVVHDVTHKDKTHNHTATTGTTHPTGTTHTTGTLATTHGSTNAGPHNSNMMNKVDPRVDSDLDGSKNMGMNQTTHTTGTHTTGTHTTGTHSAGYGTGAAGIGSTTHGSTNAGPHNSNMMNKMDPRVDSDLDGGRHAGLNQTTHSTGHPSTMGTHTTGHTGTTGTTGIGGNTYGSTNAGPHNSNMMNKIDPRVDSDMDGGRHAGLNQTTHTSGTPAMTGTHNTDTYTTGHNGSTNAGPHKSNLMNKLDPRVDSDMDGSKNMGMNQTTRTNY